MFNIGKKALFFSADQVMHEFSADQKYLCVCRSNNLRGELSIFDVEKGCLVKRFKVSDEMLSVCLSNNKRHLLVEEQDEIELGFQPK